MIDDYKVNEIISWILPVLAFVIGCFASYYSLFIGYLIAFVAPIYTLYLSIHLKHYKKGIGIILSIYSSIFIALAVLSLLGQI